MVKLGLHTLHFVHGTDFRVRFSHNKNKKLKNYYDSTVWILPSLKAYSNRKHGKNEFSKRTWNVSNEEYNYTDQFSLDAEIDRKHLLSIFLLIFAHRTIMYPWSVCRSFIGWITITHYNEINLNIEYRYKQKDRKSLVFGVSCASIVRVKLNQPSNVITNYILLFEIKYSRINVIRFTKYTYETSENNVNVIYFFVCLIHE